MARGWESKSVEAQQEEATQSSGEPRRPNLSPEQAAQQRQMEGLRLAKQSLLQQLCAATNPIRRKMIEDAVAELEGKMSKVR